MLRPLMSQPPLDRARALRKLQVGDRTPEAAEKHLAALQAAGGDLSTYARILKKSHRNGDVHHFKALADMRGQPQLLGTYRELVGCIRPATASADIGLIQQQSARHHVPLEEVSETVLTLRFHDPASQSSSRQAADLNGVLDHILSAATADQRRGRADELVSWQVSGRSAVQAMPHLERLQRFHIDGTQREDLEKVYRSVLKNCRHDRDEDVLGVLDALDGRPQALLELKAFNGLLSNSHRPAQAAADFAAALQFANQRGMPLVKVLGALARERARDPARDSSQREFADVGVAMQRSLQEPADPHYDPIKRLSVGNRNVEQALRFYQRIEAIPVVEAQRREMVEVLRDLGRHYAPSSDPHFHRALDMVSAQPQPLQTLKQFSHLVYCGGWHAENSVADLRLALGAVRPGLPLEEASRYLQAMRQADPARESHHSPVANIDAVFGYVAAGADAPERQARAADVARFQVCSRDPEKAFRLHQTARSLPQGEAIAEALLPALRKVSSRSDDALVEAMHVLSAADEPVRAARALAALLPRYRAARAMADVKMVLAASKRHQVPLEEVTETVATLRRADASNDYSHREFSDIGGGLDLILSARDVATRQERTLSMKRLLKSQDHGNIAGDAIGWILAEPLQGDDLRAATRQMIGIFDRTRRDVDPNSVHALYDRIHQAAAAERQGWLARWLRRPKKLESVAHKLLMHDSNPASAMQYLEAIATGRLPGESLRSSHRRFQKLLNVQKKSKRGDLEATNDAASLCRAFVGALRPFASGQVSSSERWARFLPILKSTRSAAHAATVHRSMTLAQSPSECAARATAFEDFLQMAGGDRVGASFLYDSACSALGRADGIAQARAALATLVAAASPAVAAMQYKVDTEYRDHPAALRQTLHDTLGQAATGAEAAEIFRRLRTPVANETLAERAAIVSGSMAGWSKAAAGLACYDQVVAHLGDHPEYVSVAAPYGHLRYLASRLPSEDPKRDVSREMLQWLQQPTTREALGSPSLADALVALGTRLVLSKDAESAMANLLAGAVEKGADGVKKGDREVHLNGIRVPIR